MTEHILVVEDDQSIVNNLSMLLCNAGYHVFTVAGQSEAVAAVENDDFDLALVDISLADGNGFGVCSYIQRTHPGIAVIFLTASDDEYSTVAGLDMGATDYISKPFRPQELLARIKVALRRGAGKEAVLEFADLRLNPANALATKSDRELNLSALEYRLLLHFLQNRSGIVTRDALRDALWDISGEYVTDNALNVAIKRLREKIEDDPSAPVLITTVRGIGWKLGR